MRSLWTEIKLVNNAPRLFDRDCVYRRGLDLSKEVLWLSLCRSKGTRATGCQSWRSKKILPIGRHRRRGFKKCMVSLTPLMCSRGGVRFSNRYVQILALYDKDKPISADDHYFDNYWRIQTFTTYLFSMLLFRLSLIKFIQIDRCNCTRYTRPYTATV